MNPASKKKGLLAWLLTLLIVSGVLGENRAWGFFAQPGTAPGQIAAASPSAIGENYDASAYDAPDCAVAPGTGEKLKYHYTRADDASFENGLWRDTSVTDTLYDDAVEAGQKLGIPTPTKVIPIKDKGQFVPNKPPVVQPSNRYQGGGTDFVNPEKVPASDLLPSQPVGGG